MKAKPKKKYRQLIVFYLILSFVICLALWYFLDIHFKDLVAIYFGSVAALLLLDFFYIYLEKKFGIYDVDY
jgi:hypothetical protein